MRKFRIRVYRSVKTSPRVHCYFSRVSIHPFLVTFFSFSSSLTLFLFNASKRSREKDLKKSFPIRRSLVFVDLKKEKEKGNGENSIDLISETRNRSEIARDERMFPRTGPSSRSGYIELPPQSSFRVPASL